uniref:Uncharacterized protein n=1 Tax=Panagrolaimus superbus TaxID=310955 RepID=A0A914Y5U0_9BILA
MENDILSFIKAITNEVPSPTFIEANTHEDEPLKKRKRSTFSEYNYNHHVLNNAESMIEIKKLKNIIENQQKTIKEQALTIKQMSEQRPRRIQIDGGDNGNVQTGGSSVEHEQLKLEKSDQSSNKVVQLQQKAKQEQQKGDEAVDLSDQQIVSNDPIQDTVPNDQKQQIPVVEQHDANLQCLTLDEIYDGEALNCSLLTSNSHCALTDLQVSNQIIKFNDFQKLVSSKTITNLCFKNVKVMGEFEEILEIDEILIELPLIERFEYWFKFYNEVTPETSKLLLHFSRFQNLKVFKLCNVARMFDLNSFSVFIRRHENVKFILEYRWQQEFAQNGIRKIAKDLEIPSSCSLTIEFAEH